MSSLEKDMFKKNWPTRLDSLMEDEDDEISCTVKPSSLSSSALKNRYTPNNWQDYFERAEDIKCDEGMFRVYILDAKTDSTETGERNPVFVMHHGAGAGALSFGLVAKRIHEESEGAYAVMALDCRGHGDTKTDNDSDFSLSQLSDDLVNVLSKVYGDADKQQFILVGHSMGGSVVVDIANRQCLPNVMGLVVLDIVEGSALEAIQSMDKVLSTRPRSFESIEQAIQWSYKSKMVRNLEAARLSIPPLVQLQKDTNKYIWRTDLELTKPYWKEWFTGLSEKFLDSPVAKLLMLAGTDRLDKTLTIAQMQGKFQLTVVMNSGHFIQEDAPDTTTATLLNFWSRYSRVVVPKPVGQA